MPDSPKTGNARRAVLIKCVVLVIVLLAGIVLLAVHGKKEETPPANVSLSSLIEVRITGTAYEYQGKTYSLDELREALRALGGESTVHILDENAKEDALTRLTEALQQDGRGYEVEKRQGG